MELSELKPTSYELLRVKVRDQTLVDIHLKLRHDRKGVSRWCIVDEWGDMELSQKGEWSDIYNSRKDVDAHRFETAEAALEVWNRGVKVPYAGKRDEHPYPDWSPEFLEEVRTACQIIRRACGHA